MKLKFYSREHSKLKDFCGYQIWHKPKPTGVYAIGVDVAEGVGGDASCASVIDCDNGMHVATYWSNGVDLDTYSSELYKLGSWYNKAFICIEQNNHGNGVIALMGGSLGALSYPNLYKRIVYNEYNQRKEKSIGFRTTSSTKPRIIENLKSALKQGELMTLDKYTILELSSFVRDQKTGRMGAKGKAKDDRVMALALAWEQARLIRESTKDSYLTNSPTIQYDPMTGFPTQL